MSEDGTKVVCRHRKARFLYQIETSHEAGISLRGSEVKSLRAGQADITESYASFEKGELWLVKAHIAEYVNCGYMKHDPRRPRKLLMHRIELTRLGAKVAERGYTLVPLAIYFKNGRAKVELGLAHGKRKFDRRDDVRERDAERDRRREHREANRNAGGRRKG